MKPARRPPASRGAEAAPSTRSDRRFAASAAAIFLVAVVLRLVHLWQLRGSPFFDTLLGDARGYDEWAMRIAGGEWIGHDVFYQAPLYPYFLAVIYSIAGHSLLAVRLVQAVIGAASCVLLGSTADRLFSKTAGLACGIGLALYAPAIFFDSLLQKSVLDIFFLTLALWIIGRVIDLGGSPRRWLALGLAMGALSLTRENALAFIVVIAAWIVWRRQQMAVAAVTFVAGLALVLLPVAARNAAVGGGFYLTTSQFGPNFYIGNNPKADGTYMSLRFGRGAPEYERQDATELAEHATGRTLTPAEVSSYWTDQALDFITGHPAAWTRLMGRKWLLLWNATEMLDTESQESYADYSVVLRALGWFGHFGVLVPLALVGAIIVWPMRQRIGILYALTFVYAASVLLFYVFARYRLPLVPLLMLFAGVAIDTVRRAIAERSVSPASLWRQHAVAATAVALVIVFANWPTLSASLMKAITENNLATALQTAGRMDEAKAHYRRALDIQPDYAPAYNNLGVAQKATGDLDEAIASYRKAIATKGDYPDAHYNLANALLARQQPKEAAEHFEIALRAIPDSAGVKNNLGIALAAQGRGTDAVAAFRAAVAAEPDSAKALRNLGSALADAGQVDEAVATLNRAASLDPKDSDIRYDLGVVLLQAGRPADAAAALRSAIQLNPRSAEAHNNLGIAFGSMGRMGDAILEFQRALQIAPNFVDAQRNLALARNAQGSH